MLPSEIQESALELLQKHRGIKTEILHLRGLSGGDINSAFLLDTGQDKYFLKYNLADAYPGMFKLEARGLELLFHAGEIRVPGVIGSAETGQYSFLLLEYLEAAPQTSDFWETFGRRLAGLHRHSDDHFGLDHDNYIGSLRQYNDPKENWIDFFREERLLVQMELAATKGLLGERLRKAFENLFPQLEEIFPSEPASLIHGDLWSGNFMVDDKGEACIIDPAVYYGFREMDIGMSRLFGGFSSEFYDAYNEAYPMAPGWQERIEICNLYPLLVHVNLFGGGYLGSVEAILKRFV
jgi:fructosamine-3-kinase